VGESGKYGFDVVVRMLLCDIVLSKPTDSGGSGSSAVGVERSDCAQAEREERKLSFRLQRDEAMLLAVGGGVGKS